MTRVSSFSEAFWDVDICHTKGWETLCKRMKDGRKVCTEAAHFFKDRAKAEMDYSKTLNNLSKKAEFKEETGGLGESLRMVKAQTQKIADVHEEASLLFTALEQDLTKFNEEQKKNKQIIEENVKKYITAKKNEHVKTMAMKKTYEEKCKDYNSAKETMKTLSSAVTVKKNELEKAELKQMKCKEARTNSDLAYKSCVESLEAARSRWEKEMELGCNQFEALEVNRIDRLRDLLWKCTNVDARACVQHDECCECVRTVLERCDITSDIQEFINTNSTGNLRPDPVLYENYYRGSKSSPKEQKRPPIQPPSPGTRPPIPRPQAQPIPATRKMSAEDAMYSSVGPPTTPKSTSNVLLKVVKSYKALTFNELSVNVGEILEMGPPPVGRPNPPGMLVVKQQNRIGLVPGKCVVKYESGGWI